MNKRDFNRQFEKSVQSILLWTTLNHFEPMLNWCFGCVGFTVSQVEQPIKGLSSCLRGHPFLLTWQSHVWADSHNSRVINCPSLGCFIPTQNQQRSPKRSGEVLKTSRFSRDAVMLLEGKLWVKCWVWWLSNQGIGGESWILYKAASGVCVNLLPRCQRMPPRNRTAASVLDWLSFRVS